MIKPQMEARANDLDRGIDDGSANSGSDGASQSSPAVAAQQKQELSNYNFKAAAAALNAQTNQSVPKPSPSAPIPPLQVLLHLPAKNPSRSPLRMEGHRQKRVLKFPQIGSHHMPN